MMQAHHYSLPFPHHVPLNVVQPAFNVASQSSPIQYQGPIDGLDPEGFSRGSSSTYPNTEHDYFTNRGASLTSHPEYLPVLPTIAGDECATGLVISGNPHSGGGITDSELFAAEDVPGYHQVQQQEWQWERLTGPVHPVHGVPPSSIGACARAADNRFATVKSSFSQSPVASASSRNLTLSPPTPQLQTPASMAIAPQPHVRPTGRVLQQQPLHINERSDNDDPDIYEQLPLAAGQPHLIPQEQAEVIDGPLRERKHACTMCHKRFDRPSTLRKHLLVHTGEKAFVCDTCGRRFGVASNLNRHVKKCVLRPVNAPKSSSGSSPGPENAQQTSSGSLPENTLMTSSDHPATPSAPSTSVTSPRGRQAQSNRDPSVPKRRRRAPSPSRWVPPSLLNFVLQCPEAKKATPVPLPPVRRNLPVEERDSYDEDMDAAPYHPRGWKDVLPGPGLGLTMGTFGGKTSRNLNLGGNGGFMGRVLVF